MSEDHDALEAIEAFIEARANQRGLDPEIVYSYNDAELWMSDLRALTAEVRRLRARGSSGDAA